MDIEHWRKEIDEIDVEILRLLNMRARLALKVGALKCAARLPFCDPDRERFVLLRLQDLNTGPLDDRAVYKLFRRIIRESRRIQTNVEPTNVAQTNLSQSSDFVRSRKVS
jgi:chorismate mutase